MATISVCIPAYRRDEQLYRCRAAIKNQSFKDYEIVIGEHPVIGIARNFAARKAKGKFLVFVDADVVLNHHALHHYNHLISNNPSCLIIGMYHWIPPFYETKPDGIVGNDPRRCELWESEKPTHEYCLDFYSGNFGLTKELFFNIGEFDEQITKHGGEDCDFAIRLQKAGHGAIFSSKLVGFHHYHDRDQEKNVAEAKENAEYLRRKHGLRSMGIRKGKKGELPLVYNT